MKKLSLNQTDNFKGGFIPTWVLIAGIGIGLLAICAYEGCKGQRPKPAKQVS